MWLKEKCKDFKNRLTDRHMYSVIVGLIVIGVIVFSYQAKVSADYKNRLHAQYSRALNDLVEEVSNIETSLSKGAVVTDPKTFVRLSNEIYAKAASASAGIGQLPLSDTTVDNTAKFLSQVGDFTASLSLRYMDTKEIKSEERNTMVELARYAVVLRDSLYDVQEKIYSGAYQYENPSHFGGGVSMASGMEKTEEQFRDYPSLLYDGPFSDHVQTKESPMLQNLPEISMEEAMEKVENFVATERMGEIQYDGICGGHVPTYMFSVQPDENDKDRTVTLEITQKGGMLLNMLDNRFPMEPKIEIEDAKNRARAYLEKLGILNMTDSYHEQNAGIITINFAYTDGDIICYPDLVKVKIFMDTGEVAGLEASGYIMNHTDRTFPTTRFSEEQAYGNLSSVVSVENSRFCVIPTNSGGEIFCREFKCTVDDKTFLIYQNAETGREEDVLMLLYTEGGMLTI